MRLQANAPVENPPWALALSPSRATICGVYRVSPVAARKLVDRADAADEAAMRHNLALLDRLGFDEDGDPNERYPELQASLEEVERVADARRRERRLWLGVCRVDYGMSRRERDRLQARVEFERGRNRFNVRALMAPIREPLARVARVVRVHRSARRVRRHRLSFTRRVTAAGAGGGDPPDGEVDDEDDASVEARVLRYIEYDEGAERDDEHFARELELSVEEVTGALDRLLAAGELWFDDLLVHVDGPEYGFVPTLVPARRRVRW